MKIVFADTGYWIALLNRRDQLHPKALAVSRGLGEARIMTSEMVLVEVLNGLAKEGAQVRGAAVSLVTQQRANPNMAIVPQTSAQFQRAVTLYQQREDKHWTLTDCASILIMQDVGITEVLSHDRHFVQAGFKALLRDDVQARGKQVEG